MSASLQAQIDTLASSIATAEGILADLRRTHRTMPPMGTELLDARERIRVLEEQIGALDAEQARAEHEALEARTTLVELTQRLSDVTREAQTSYAKGYADAREAILGTLDTMVHSASAAVVSVDVDDSWTLMARARAAVLRRAIERIREATEA